METTVCSDDTKQRLQNKITLAVKSKLTGHGIENADELSVKCIEMMTTGHSKEEILSELEKYSKVEENISLDQMERHNKSFVDWLFGYSSIVSAVSKDTVSTPLTEADTEATTENHLNNQSTSVSTPPIDDVSDDEDTKLEKNSNTPAAIAESVLKHEPSSDDIIISEDDDLEDNSSVDSDDIPELQSRESDNEQNLTSEPNTEEQKVETEEKAPEVEKKPELPKRRSFIRIKEGKSGRFTPIKSEDRHSFVKRNLARVASQLDIASQVQKKIMSHANAVANASESQNLNKKKSTASLNGTLEKKKSFRRDSITSNGSTGQSVYSSTNATFMQSFANKSFPKTSKTTSSTTTTSTITPSKSKVTRCSYWPNCNRGDECKFWHPKELCPNLNNCPDGDQCLYIHPAIPQSQLNKNKLKKSESSLEVSENFNTPKYTLQKKSSRISLNGTINQQASLVKKSSKANLKESSSTNNLHAIECKFGANCTRPDCKFSHPSPAAILAANALKKKDSKLLKEKKSYDVLKHKESRSKLISSENEEKAEDGQTIFCRFGSECKRPNCKFLHED
ncbi:hypothetical protein BCR36DRAFT_580463 [Piromyces finnis]|uniref:C3H1-type domain-containing protein n=1 Tax=Piromyces finnis TaxID=1754191 RepID=A0A1Y1VKK3_9FUNG|nr:hypothetical protein BCR36DRAFT_580463 [Piromyces finnis]|eukprot:ORX57897.1 hypothetical protein BCR36DRAFT_580463 [Piromyces finnis]